MNKPKEGFASAIRAEIAKIPAAELVYAKPSRILPLLEKAGVEITTSVRSATSKLLAEAREKASAYYRDEDTIAFDPGIIRSTQRQALAMQLIEACGLDFEVARGEIARLESFAKKIKGA